MKLIICDYAKNDPPITGDAVFVYWRGLGVCSNKEIFLSNVIEQNSNKLRKEYVKFIDDLGNLQPRGECLREQLGIREGFSFWWMTLLCEKDNIGKSRIIEDAIRVLALKLVLKKLPVNEVQTKLASLVVGKSIQLLCNHNNISYLSVYPIFDFFYWIREKNIIIKETVLGVFWLVRYLFSLVLFLFLREKTELVTSRGILFFSYFFGVDRQASSRHTFTSDLWSGVIDKLREKDVPTTWVHLFVKNEKLTPIRAYRQICDLNKGAYSDFEKHYLLDQFVNRKVLSNVFFDAIRVIPIWKKLSLPMLASLMPASSYLWPMIQTDWASSIVGKSLWKNLIQFNYQE